jgi:formylmethanofuran dehydrogenase subunit A
MSSRRERWDKEAQRLQNTVLSGNPAAIKGARTRFQNAHAAYWQGCREAWADVKAGAGTIEEIAQKHDVLVSDIGEVALGDGDS